MSDATSAVPAAIASSSTTPNDSPSSRREARDRSRRGARRAFSSSVTRPSHSTRGISRRTRARPSRGPSPATHSSASRSSPANASSSTAEALAGLVAADEQDRRARRGPRVRRRRTPSTSTPFGRISHVPPNVSLDVALRLLRDRGAHREAVAPSRAAARRNVSYQPLRPARDDVERADRGEVGADERGVVARPARAARGGGGRRARTLRSASSVRPRDRLPRGDRRDRAVARDSRVLGPTVVMPGSGGGPSHGRDDPGVDADARGARARARAPGPARRRTTDSEYGHESVTRSASRASASHRSCPVIPRRVGRGRDGQLGCIRSQCSGAARISSSKRCASSWVTRATSSRSRAAAFDRERRTDPDAVPAVGAEVAPPPGAAARPSAARASPGPPGSVVRSPKNSTSTPSPVRSRSHSRHTTSFPRSSARAPRCPAVGTERDRRPCRRPGGSRRTTRRARAARPARRRPSLPYPAPASHAPAKSQLPRCGSARTTPLPAAIAASMCSTPAHCEASARARRRSSGRAGTARTSSAP